MTATPSPTVAVRGHWTAEVPPEVARIRVSVGARSGDRQQALRELGRRVEEARDALTGYSAAVESVEASPLWVHPQFRDGRPRERVTGYLAGVHLTVTVVDFTVVGDLFLRLADRDMVGLDGPFWALREDSDAYRQARTAAVREARQRAEEYAAAVGSRLTGLVEIADTGLSSGQDAMASAPAMFRAAKGESLADRIALDVEPVPQTVHASVEARFTVSQPDFG